MQIVVANDHQIAWGIGGSQSISRVGGTYADLLVEVVV